MMETQYINIKKKKSKDTNISGAVTIYAADNNLYYTVQNVKTKDDNTIDSISLTLYKYDSKNELYTFNHGDEGNYAQYIGNGLFEFIDSKENNVVIDSNGKIKELNITNKNGEKEKLEISKYYNINYEYTKVE